VKRSPLRRLSPMKRSRSKAGAELRDWQTVKALVVERSGGWCEASTPACPVGLHRGEHLHHVILRSHGGPDEPWNLLHLCHAAHRWVHDNPARSYEMGLMRRGVA
jgi:hypothetical protein